MAEHNKTTLEHIADMATRWIGSTTSLLVHTLVFIIAFALPALHILGFDKMLLVLTTIVSLEAIYLAIFIQMSVNKNSADIENIQEDVEEIQEDIEEIQEDVEEIQEDVEEIQEDVEEIQEDLDEDDAKDSTAAPNPSKLLAAGQLRSEKIQHIQQLIDQLQQEVALLRSEPK